MPEETTKSESEAAQASAPETKAAAPATRDEYSPEPPLKVERLGFTANITETVKHVKKSVDAQGGKVRGTDKLSAWMVPCTSVALAAAVLCAGWARMAISIICLASLLYYILGRIGILRSMNARQANLVWHLLMGTFLLGIIFTFVYLEIVNRIR